MSCNLLDMHQCTIEDQCLINKHLISLKLLNFETPQVGFEPTTNRLTVDRSATELLRITKSVLDNNSECSDNWQGFMESIFCTTVLS